MLPAVPTIPPDLTYLINLIATQAAIRAGINEKADEKHARMCHAHALAVSNPAEIFDLYRHNRVSRT